ncbi:MAG: hypothetical protein J7M24_01055, partial [Candidatus Latescibacteria bacterium]|nr:hypothetical protein [Candidatus Latescibacterota bacterium]
MINTCFKRFLRIALPLFLCLSAVFPASAQNRDKPKPLHAPAVLPGVEPVMLTPQYWIALHDDADEIIMTPARIEAWNSRLRSKRIDLSDKHGQKNPLVNYYENKRQVGLYMNPILPLEQPAALPGDSLRTWIRANLDWVRSRDFYDGRMVT